MKTMKTTRQQRLLLGLAATIGMQAGAYAATAPDVPDQVKVPADERLVFRAHASGAQIYLCQQGTDGKSQWTLKAPKAQLHDRKGAVVAEGEAVMIPGSRGSLSYLVKPLGDGESRAWSLAHGAGRKWSRSEARLRMRERFGKKQLVQTALGGRVICEERDLLYEEAPAAYKNIEAVIQDLVDAGLASVIATFRPLLTYKMRKQTR
jgi:hypothetical protein